MAKTYTIKSEDKAAFLNRLKAGNIPVNSASIRNNSLDNTFTITVKDPRVETFIDQLLAQSPNIDVVRNNSLEEMARQILKNLKK